MDFDIAILVLGLSRIAVFEFSAVSKVSVFDLTQVSFKLCSNLSCLCVCVCVCVFLFFWLVISPLLVWFLFLSYSMSVALCLLIVESSSSDYVGNEKSLFLKSDIENFA